MKSKPIIYCLLILITQITRLQGTEADDLLDQCAAIFNIPTQTLSIERLHGGVSNRVYLLSTENKEQFPLKLFTKRSLDDVYQIEQTVLALSRFGIQIPETIAITLFQNKFPLHISRFQAGHHVNDDDLLSIATLMAELHIKGSLITPLPLKKYKTEEHYRNLFKRCQLWPHTEVLMKIYEGLDLTYLDEIPKGTIHGDFSYTNLIHGENEKLTLIDFDHLCTSYLLTDLVRCQMFYGFDDTGGFQEEKIENFASQYDTFRPLTTMEKEHFYSHMKLMMIDTALEMWYQIHITGNLPIDVVNFPENRALVPELLVKKIENLQGKKTLALKKNIPSIKTPLIFFGMSGVGKTTMIKGLLQLQPQLFYIPVFTCTRSPRPDDDQDQFEYITVKEFLKLEQEEVFLFTMHEGVRYYGYRKSHLCQTNKYPLLNCSAYGLENAKVANGIFVLIEGDSEQGLMHRNNRAEQEHRTLVNQRVFNQFYSNDWFLKQMDIIHDNQWSQPIESIQSLLRKILEKIDLFNHEQKSDQAA